MAYVKADVVAREFCYTRDQIYRKTRTDPNFPHRNFGTKERPQYRYVIEEVERYFTKGEDQ